MRELVENLTDLLQSIKSSDIFKATPISDIDNPEMLGLFIVGPNINGVIPGTLKFGVVLVMQRNNNQIELFMETTDEQNVYYRWRPSSTESWYDWKILGVDNTIIMTKGFDLNNAINNSRYSVSSAGVVSTLLHLPNDGIDSGELLVEYIPFDKKNIYGVQRVTHMSSGKCNVYVRRKTADTFEDYFKLSGTKISTKS